MLIDLVCESNSCCGSASVNTLAKVSAQPSFSAPPVRSKETAEAMALTTTSWPRTRSKAAAEVSMVRMRNDLGRAQRWRQLPASAMLRRLDVENPRRWHWRRHSLRRRGLGRAVWLAVLRGLGTHNHSDHSGSGMLNDCVGSSGGTHFGDLATDAVFHGGRGFAMDSFRSQPCGCCTRANAADGYHSYERLRVGQLAGTWDSVAD
mmetsp:Transcript_32139/g.106314  ORF Transcript_32139/g.106314 Transcript_32139/m.106314 type:complete len:205 (+) Transcript_32139:81-695(+)